MKEQDINVLMQQNISDVIKNGPRISTSRNVWIEARDPGKNRILLGGLGAMGCGIMWVSEDERHKQYPGYDNAPEKDSNGQ